MDQNNRPEKSSRPRGRPAKKKALLTANMSTSVQPDPPPVDQAKPGDETDEVSDAFSSQGEHPSAFATLLGFLIKNDRSEVLRIAREVGVSDNTVYRWLNGTSEPRRSHLHQLLNVLPQMLALSFTDTAQHERTRNVAAYTVSGDVQREIFHRVLEQAAITVDNASRRWHIMETIFEYALLHFDPDRHGLALTYARLMPPHKDGTIHSLCEMEMRGQAPWAFALDFKTYLGSTTLAGAAAIFQRVKTWSSKDVEARIPVGLDKNERSSCAAPVMRGGRLAGVLIVSSALPDFARDPAIPGAVNDYANMLATGLADDEFYPVDLVKLVPMPELDWQRDNIARTYLNRVVECARMDGLSFPEAERKVLYDLEREFERHAGDPKDVKPAPHLIDVEQS
ncbi:MAG: helix-turn-helix transcriptional regulator [Ktedonobacteraceae bacterium]